MDIKTALLAGALALTIYAALAYRRFSALLKARHFETWAGLGAPDPDAPRTTLAGQRLLYYLLSGSYLELRDAELDRLGNWLRLAAGVVLLALVCAFVFG